MNKNRKIISLLTLITFAISLTTPLVAMESKDNNTSQKLSALELLRKKQEENKKKFGGGDEKNGESKIEKQEDQGEICAICQESLKNKSCITLHKSTVGSIPHTFHASCFYNWCKITHKKELENFDKGAKSEGKISIACPLCHEWDETKDPLPKKNKNDPNEKLAYPNKEFFVSVSELCKGYIEYLQKLTLKEKFENLENLPPQIIVDTLIALAKMSAEEREKVYKNEKENDLKIERIVCQRVLHELHATPLCIMGFDWKSIKSELPDEILTKAINAALSLLGDRPLAKEFAWNICYFLNNKQKVPCFKRAFDCLDTLTPQDKLLAHASSMNAYIFDENRIEDVENAESILDYCLTADLLDNFAGSLPLNICAECFDKFLKKAGPRPKAKKTVLNKVFKNLPYATQLDFFDVVYPQLHGTHKAKRLIELKKELFEKKGTDEVCNLVAAYVKDEKIDPLDKSGLIKEYEKEYFKSLPIPEKIELLEILPTLMFANTVTEIAALSAEEMNKRSIDSDKLARNLQRAICNKNGYLFSIDQKVLSNILKILDTQKIYKEFVTTIFDRLDKKEKILFFKEAAKNNDFLFPDSFYNGDTESSDSEDSDSEDESTIDAGKIGRYQELCGFYGKCLPVLPIELQILHLKKFLEIEALDKKLRGRTVRKIIKADKSHDVLLGCYDEVYPLLKVNQKMDLLISDSEKLIKRRGNKAVATALNNICEECETYEIVMQRGAYDITKTSALLKKYWSILSHEQRLRLFSYICHAINGEQNLFATKTVAEIFEQLGKQSTSESTWHDYFFELFRICGWPKVNKSRELLENFWNKIPKKIHGTLLRAFLTSCKIFEDYKEICTCLQKFGKYIGKDWIDNWVLTSETKTLREKYALPRIYWNYLSARGRLRAAKPLIFETNNLYNEQKKVTFENFEKESYLPNFMQQLASTSDATEQLKILGLLWPNIEQKYLAKGLMVALVFINNSRDKIFEIIKPAEWLTQSDYKEKKKILHFLWREDAKNRLCNYQMVFKSCNEQEKKRLKKRYDKKVVSTFNALSIATQIIANHIPGFTSLKSKQSMKTDNILRDPDNQI